MTVHSDVQAFVLAGGVSSRMGVEKGLLLLGGVPVVERTAGLAEPLARGVSIVGPPEKYGGLGLRVIPDGEFAVATERGRSKGPLWGIATALANSDAASALILACDLPYLTREWLEWFLARGAKSSAQAVVPMTSGGLEPLAAVYRKECLATVEQSLNHGLFKMTDVLKELTVEEVPERDWAHIDPGGIVLKNMNTRADYEEARKWWESRTIP